MASKIDRYLEDNLRINKIIENARIDLANNKLSIPSLSLRESKGGNQVGCVVDERGFNNIDGTLFEVKEACRLAEWILEITRDEDIKE